MSEADLDAVRREIERRFLFNIRGHGTLIAKDQKQDFEKRLESYRTQLHAHAAGLRGLVKGQAKTFIEEAVRLVRSRATHAFQNEVNVDGLRQALDDAIERLVQGQPSVSRRYKDVTFEHTQSTQFRDLVRKTLPADVLKRLGRWDEHFKATKDCLPDRKGMP